ncbi:MAG: IMPACT family protein, partial [Anaerolineae bacterium]
MTVVASPLQRFTVADGVASAEVIIKNSVFIGTVAPAQDETEAHTQIEHVRARYPDANHHAWAYIITGGAQAEIGSSDDGEPGGTAGRPMLAVLEGRGILQAVAIGTRYFGGTKLGTGGLVRAYSECIRRALTDLPVAQMMYYHRAALSVEYAL